MATDSIARKTFLLLLSGALMRAVLIGATLALGRLRGIDAQCSSTACQEGRCVDASDGSAELGSAASCAAAFSDAQSAGDGDCSAEIGGVKLGNICARTCGWCSPLLAFVDLEQVATTFCSTHVAASCAPASSSGTSAAQCGATDLIGAVGGLHPHVAREVCEGPSGSPTGCEYSPGTNHPPGCVVHPFKLSVDEIAWLTGSGDVTNPIAVAVKAQKLDGAAVAELSSETLTSFPQAVAAGDAIQFAQTRDMMFRQVMPGTREFAASDALADLRTSMSSSPTAALDLLATAGAMPFASPQEVSHTGPLFPGHGCPHTNHTSLTTVCPCGSIDDDRSNDGA